MACAGCLEEGDGVLHPWGAWKKLCPHYAVDFKGSDLTERLSEERLKCLELVKNVGLDEFEEEDVYSLLETIGEELLTEDLDELEKQRPPAPFAMKHLAAKILQSFCAMLRQTMDHLEEVDLDVERQD